MASTQGFHQLPAPLALQGHGVKLVPLQREHADGLKQAAADGTVRDSVMYSLLAGEWPESKKHLEYRLNLHHAD